MKKLLMVPLLGLVLLATGCPSKTLTQLAQYSDSIAIANQGLQAGAQSAQQSLLLAPAEDIQVQLLVIKVAKINDKLADAYSEASKNNPNWVADVDSALALGADLNANSLLFIKNPSTRATLTAILASVRSTLDAIALQVKGVS